MTTSSPIKQGFKSTWQTLLWLGILTILLGVIIAAWPGPTTLVVGILFGIYLLVSGAFNVVAGIIGESEHRVLAVISGGLSIALGVLCFRDDPFNSIAVLGIWVGISWIFLGVTSIVVGASNKHLPNRVWVVILGLLTVVGGGVLVAYSFSVEVLVLVTGIWAVAIGVVQVISALQLRSKGKQVEQGFAAVQQNASDLVGRVTGQHEAGGQPPAQPGQGPGTGV